MNYRFITSPAGVVAPLSENSLARIVSLVALIRRQRSRLVEIRNIRRRRMAELLDYTERHDDEHRHMISQQTRLLNNALIPVSASLVWRCVSDYLHSVARKTPKPLCENNPEYIELLAQVGRCHDSEQLCIDWLRHHENSLRDVINS